MENTSINMGRSLSGKKAVSGRNGEIELLRFIACIAIIFFHLNKHILGRVTFSGSRWGFFNEAVIAVEFFFI